MNALDFITDHLNTAKATLLLNLSAANSQKEATKGNLLAHRIIRNMASITYHNLSPHTRMQPLCKDRRIGGTDTGSLRRRRSLHVKKRASPSALDSFEIESATSSLTGPTVEAEVLTSLQVMPKPIRGPIVPILARKNKVAAWDGQRTEALLQESPAYQAHLQSKVDLHRARIEDLRAQPNPDFKKIEKATYEMRQERGPLKGALKRKADADERAAIQAEASNLLWRVASEAQRNTGAWMGASRISKWASGAWLPP